MHTPESLIDALPAHLALLDQSGRICRVNKAWKEFAERNGVKSEQVGVGCDYLAVCNAATGSDQGDGAKAAQGILAVLKGQSSRFVLEYPCHSPNVQRWFRLEASPAILEGQRCAVLLHHDITELRTADEAVRESEQQRLRILEMSSDAILAVDEEQNIVIFNKGAERTFGYAAAEIMGKSLDVLLPERFRVGHRVLVEEFGASGIPSRPMGYRDLVGALHKDGHEFLAESSISQFTQGGKHYYAATLRDVTRRLEAERKLKESEEMLRAVVENAPAYIVILDRNARVEFINRSETPAYTREQLQGMNIFDFLQPEYLAPVREALSAVFERRERVNLKISTQRPDKSIRWFSVRVGPISESGKVDAAIWIATDTTEQHALEDQLRQSQKMESIGRLAGGVAHDFNNLLTAISGHAELIARKPRDARERDHAKQILEASTRAAKLTSQLLAFSRKQVLQPKRINLNEVVSEAARLLSRLIGEDVALKTVLASDLHSVLADPSQIDQVLMNLAVNARDAMPSGGSLTMETCNVDLTPEYTARHVGATPGPHVQLSVSDTGEGMSSETMARIFEPFFTTKPLGKGTGLGLATVHGVVKQSGGHIFVYSEPGRGTTFKLYFPANHGAPATHRRTSNPLPDTRGHERILLVEDEEAVRNLTQDVLAERGYAVTAVGSPAEALGLCKESNVPFDMLLTDVILPGIGGRALAEEMKRRKAKLKVLFVSGYTDNVIIHHGMLDEGVNFLQKPFNIAQLAAKVREVLDGGNA